MKNFFSLSTFLVLLFTGINAQDYKDEVLITIAGRDIPAGEFERIYNKNNNDNIAQKQTVDEYLDMFINYKLKVIEAEEMGMDTTSKFLNEFNSYKKQLAQPYLTSEELTEQFAVEAYERMKEEVNASHIMIRLGAEAPAGDTLQAYDKLMEIRERVLKGEDFETVARATSDDPSARTNGGNLGWFSAFRMVYPFESAAYNTPIGEISMPVRSGFGYHILKINGRRPAQGSVRVAHVFVAAPVSMSADEAEQAKNKINMVYDSLKTGSSFSEMADKYSDDQSSGRKGGELPWFSSGQMIPAFDSVAFSLEKPGDYSSPFKSDYGWHLVKLLEKKGIGSYDEEKAEILSNIKKGDRGKSKDKAFIAQLKEEYGFEFYPENYDKVLSTLDSTVFSAKWEASKASRYFELPLFNIGNHNVTIGKFAEYMEKRLINRKTSDYGVLLSSIYLPFEDHAIMEFEESNLENKYPEFRHIVQEYHDGILLFDLTDKMVWTKAVQDTAGLEKFYQDNKDNYMWGERAEVYTVIVNDSTLGADLLKKAAKLVKKNRFQPEKFREEFCPQDTTGNCMEIVQNKFEKDDHEQLSSMKWKKGVGKFYPHKEGRAFLIITNILEPAHKQLDETRGLVIADYQKHLEDQWISELRDKYEIRVNKELLPKIQD
ncbi:MAG: peptidylprolyl isomerase [Bacteroidales bacterium]|nr:peptidylprolyl isomerase [Bacteroidales bacterium]